MFNSITREKNKVVALLSQQTVNTIVLRCMIRCITKLQQSFPGLVHAIMFESIALYVPLDSHHLNPKTALVTYAY